MIFKNVMMKGVAILGLILLLGLTINACSPTMSWKEEVKLNDGRVIVLNRHFNLGGYPTLDASERTPLDETITFTLPDSSKTISWKTEFNDRVPEPNSLSPLLLDVVGGIPYLATSPAGCIAYNKWGRPNPPYILYKYVNNEWMRVPLKELPVMLVQGNLIGKPASSLLKPYYTVEAAKAEREDGNVINYEKTILRETVKDAGGSRCGEMVYDGKGGWIGIGWFRKKQSLKACLNYCTQKKIESKYCPCGILFKEKE